MKKSIFLVFSFLLLTIFFVLSADPDFASGDSDDESDCGVIITVLSSEHVDSDDGETVYMLDDVEDFPHFFPELDQKTWSEYGEKTPPMLIDIPPKCLCGIAEFLPFFSLITWKNTCRTTRRSLKLMNQQMQDSFRNSYVDYFSGRKLADSLRSEWRCVCQEWEQLSPEANLRLLRTYKKVKLDNMIKAVRYNKLDSLRLAIEDGYSVDTVDDEGQPLLMIAAQNHYHAIFRLLLSAGADFNIRNSDGQTPLLYTAWISNTSASRMLIEAGACVFDRDRSDYTPLVLASQKGNQYIVSLLLETGVQDQMGEEALGWAISTERRSIVRKLLDAGAGSSLSPEDSMLARSLATKHCDREAFL